MRGEQVKSFIVTPVAIGVSKLRPPNGRLSSTGIRTSLGHRKSELAGKLWGHLPAAPRAELRSPAERRNFLYPDYIGAFTIDDSSSASLDAWSNIIRDDDGTPAFRLVALSEARRRTDQGQLQLEQLIREKDTLLRELQHRVKNNLQMITALIRLEARALPDDAIVTSFDRLAGRIESLALLYRSLSETTEDSVDLGTYLSEIASAVMRAHAVEGIHLNLQVDSWPVSLNVAMPAGLVVNELLTNALKHAFIGRESGTITVQCVVQDAGCQVVVEDNGVGFASGVQWPTAGKMSALIAKSLIQNANARIKVDSAPGHGVRVTIYFDRADAEPESSST